MDRPHVAARLFNTPHLIARAKAETIARALAPKLGVAVRTGMDYGDYGPPPDGAAAPPPRHFIPDARTDRRDRPYILTRRGVAVIAVHGTLAHSALAAEPPSGLTSYTMIGHAFRHALASADVRAILFDVDSFGGEGSDSAFALAAEIRAARGAKPIWAAVDEAALSAGYLLASAADVVALPEFGWAGSIGVYALHLDESGLDRNMGLTWSYIIAGEHKVDGNPHQPLDDGFRADLQALVDQSYMRFCAAVGAARPALGVDGARATQARLYRGPAAVAAGLADRVETFAETLAALDGSAAPEAAPVAGTTAPATPGVSAEVARVVAAMCAGRP